MAFNSKPNSVRVYKPAPKQDATHPTPTRPAETASPSSASLAPAAALPAANEAEVMVPHSVMVSQIEAAVYQATKHVAYEHSVADLELRMVDQVVQLNKWASEGWELIAVVPPQPRAYLRRIVKGESR